MLGLTGDAIRAVRKAKSDARLSMKAPVALLRAHCAQSTWDLLTRAEGDLRAAGSIAAIEHRPALGEGPPEFEVLTTLGP